MKMIKRAVLIIVILLTVSCASLSRQSVDVQRDEFLNKFPMLNNEILGELRYDNPDLNLETLGIKNYPELFSKVDLTEDYENVIYFIRDDNSEEKFIVQRDTFVVCLRSVEYILIVCDDAATPNADKVYIGKPVPDLDDFYADFLDKYVE